MKRFVLGILFLFAVVWGWNTMQEKYTSATEQAQTETTETATATGSIDQMISVLTEANSPADMSVRTSPSPSVSFARRYRPAGFSFDKLFDYLVLGQKTIFNSTFKTTAELSQAYAARIKYEGYYLYTLRKMII